MTEEANFAIALEKPDPAVRAAFLYEACRNAAERRRVEALLASYARAPTYTGPTWACGYRLFCWEKPAGQQVARFVGFTGPAAEKVDRPVQSDRRPIHSPRQAAAVSGHWGRPGRFGHDSPARHSAALNYF